MRPPGSRKVKAYWDVRESEEMQHAIQLGTGGFATELPKLGHENCQGL